MQSIEYSQTRLFYVETYEILADIESSYTTTKITFKDPKVALDFFQVCKSWDIYSSSRLQLLEDAYLWFLDSPKSHSTSRDYGKFMDLIIAFLEGDFKLKETK